MAFALQLYSIKEIYEENPLKALKAASDAGYRAVEFYGKHFSDSFYRALLDETNLACAGWHTPIEAFEGDAFESTLRSNLVIGSRFACVPWFNSDKLDDWKRLADRLNIASKRLAPYGIKTGFHCHAHEFYDVEGSRPWDVIAENTSEAVVLQLDTGNAASAGVDIYAELARHPFRCQTVHLKPYSSKDGFAAPAGKDDTDWGRIISFCEGTHVNEWLTVEYESTNEPLEAVRATAAYLMMLTDSPLPCD